MEGDILTDVLRAVHVSGAIFFDVHATIPWVAQAPPSRQIRDLVMPDAEHLIEYHVIVDGSCWGGLLNDTESPIELQAGSILIFPHGDPHFLSSEPDSRTRPRFDIFDPETAENPRPFYLGWGAEGGPKGARVICGFLGCDAGPFNPLLQALPRMVHVSHALGGRRDWLAVLVSQTVDESETRRLGGGGVLAKLSELIFIEAIRRFTEDQPSDARSWLVGLNDPLVGQALRALHDEPARDWTLKDLARMAGASRTTLAERFSEHVGVPPITYLTRWRMQLAASLLKSGAQPLARIAESVGYESEAAFSRAFKRSTGYPPSKWRRRQADGSSETPVADPV